MSKKTATWIIFACLLAHAQIPNVSHYSEVKAQPIRMGASTCEFLAISYVFVAPFSGTAINHFEYDAFGSRGMYDTYRNTLTKAGTGGVSIVIRRTIQAPNEGINRVIYASYGGAVGGQIDFDSGIAERECNYIVSNGDCDKGGGGSEDPCVWFPEYCVGKALGDEGCTTSPIVIDLDGNGFSFSGPDDAVLFDSSGSGHPWLIQWIAPDSNDGFLFRDGNGDGIVNNGTELFGDNTPSLLNPQLKFGNGYAALAQWDDPLLGGNLDLEITPADGVWDSLQVWVDDNHDGLCASNEVMPLSETGITKLDLIPKEGQHSDRYGNGLALWSWAFRDKTRLKTVDVFFRILAK